MPTSDSGEVPDLNETPPTSPAPSDSGSVNSGEVPDLNETPPTSPPGDPVDSHPRETVDDRSPQLTEEEEEDLLCREQLSPESSSTVAESSSTDVADNRLDSQVPSDGNHPETPHLDPADVPDNHLDSQVPSDGNHPADRRAVQKYRSINHL